MMKLLTGEIEGKVPSSFRGNSERSERHRGRAPLEVSSTEHNRKNSKKEHGIMLNLLVLIVLVCLSSHLFSESLEIAGGVNCVKDKNVEFFLGYTDKIKPGMELYIKRGKKEIGKIKVVRVGEYTSWGEVINLSLGENVRIGDTVSNLPGRKKEKTTVNTVVKQETYNKVVKTKEPKILTGKVNVVIGDELGITLGENHGLKKNMELQVKRGEEIIGTIKVCEVGENYSICEIVKLEKDKTIERGDIIIVKKEK